MEGCYGKICIEQCKTDWNKENEHKMERAFCCAFVKPESEFHRRPSAPLASFPPSTKLWNRFFSHISDLPRPTAWVTLANGPKRCMLKGQSGDRYRNREWGEVTLWSSKFFSGRRSPKLWLFIVLKGYPPSSSYFNYVFITASIALKLP